MGERDALKGVPKEKGADEKAGDGLQKIARAGGSPHAERWPGLGAAKEAVTYRGISYFIVSLASPLPLLKSVLPDGFQQERRYAFLFRLIEDDL